MLATMFKAFGIDIVPASFWSSGNNFLLAWVLYSISAIMLSMAFLPALSTENPKETIKKTVKDFLTMHKHSGRAVTDYYDMYKDSIYINLAILCAFGTSVVLILGAQLNGPVLGGILTMVGFGALGKHIKNVAPVVLGAIISAYVNKWDPAASGNIVAIMFSSGLAPIAGAFGPIWGLIAGFIHVNVASYIGDLNEGMNLYNNGFAGCFVVVFLLPIIGIFKRDSTFEPEKYR